MFAAQIRHPSSRSTSYFGSSTPLAGRQSSTVVFQQSSNLPCIRDRKNTKARAATLMSCLIVKAEMGRDANHGLLVRTPRIKAVEAPSAQTNTRNQGVKRDGQAVEVILPSSDGLGSFDGFGGAKPIKGKLHSLPFRLQQGSLCHSLGILSGKKDPG